MIYIFTHSYPFSKYSEPFLCGEMELAEKIGLSDNITLVPLVREVGIKTKNGRDRVKINYPLYNYSIFHNVWLFVELFFSPFFWKLFKCKRIQLSRIEYIKQGVKFVYAAMHIVSWIKKNKRNIKDGDVLYSYWCHYNTLAIAMAKEKAWLPPTIKCVSRAHRYDIYEETTGVCSPFREFSLRALDCVYACSKAGADFLRQRYPQIADKFKVSYLGAWPVGKDDEQKMLSLSAPDNEYRIVSCSYVSPVKRIKLLLEGLAFLSTQTEGKTLVWHHYGGGELLDELKKDSLEKEKTYPFLKVVWHGNVGNAEIREAYLKNYYHLFVNVSKSEGLPVSLMEALSAGIPVLATDVGGNREIACNKSGGLLKSDFTEDEFATAVMQIIKQGGELRKSAYSLFCLNFSAPDNYKAFYDEISQ